MTIRFWCARCGQVFTARGEEAGHRARCRVCGHIQSIPHPREAPPEASAYELAPVPVPLTPPPQARPAPEPEARPSTRGDRLRGLLMEASRTQGLSVLLLVLSAADLFMTYFLMRTSPRFVESNPVAQWFFHRWNIGGMVIFKFATIGAAVAMSEVIERRRPGWGQLVLLIGCAAAAWVLWYSVRLYLGFAPLPTPEEV